ncbi:MAG: hypothetical protein PsegKO_29170 [Pseudohongiellaceae bacterium]
MDGFGDVNPGGILQREFRLGNLQIAWPTQGKGDLTEGFHGHPQQGGKLVALGFDEGVHSDTHRNIMGTNRGWQA